MTTPATIPVTVVAGFLGAGKTTLMNHLLRNAGGGRLAVLVNDFGELDIDRSLIAEVTDDVQALTNGCICCSMQSDLIEQIMGLAARNPAPDRILIECSGVSDPARIARTLGYPRLHPAVRLDSILTIVDPTTLGTLEGEHARLARAQIAAADLLALNKTDLVERHELDAVREQWLAPQVRSVECVAAQVPPALVLDGARSAIAGTPEPLEGHAEDSFETWTLELPGAFRLESLRAALDSIPAGVFRIKGAVALAERPGQAFWLQWVGGRTDLRPAARADSTEGSRLVVLNRHGAQVRAHVERLLRESLDGPRAAGAEA